MEQIAYGPLALLPETFWGLTPAEFVQLCAGYRWREDRIMQRLAWQTAYLLQPYGFTGSPDALLGKSSAQDVEAVDALIGTGAAVTYADMIERQKAKGLSKG